MSEAAAEQRAKEEAAEKGLMVQCATCGVRVHRKCYGVAEGAGAGVLPSPTRNIGIADCRYVFHDVLRGSGT